MDKYLYVAMTGASQNALAQKAHANNLANISTNGFQRDLEQARSMPVFGDSFPARAFALTERPATDFSQGALVETGRDLDVAVSGDGWLAVQAPDGSEAYVRTASMNVDALGILRAGNGMPIMGNGGPIVRERLCRQQSSTVSVKGAQRCCCAHLSHGWYCGRYVRPGTFQLATWQNRRVAQCHSVFPR